MSSLKPNQTFAQRYELVERIGFGGFAEVWKAKRESGFMQAIKIFNRLDEEGTQLARMEFERVFNLNHHRLLKATDFGVHEGQPYLVMPLLENGNAYKQVGQLDEGAIAKVLLDISSGLAFLHNLPDPIIHQDIKPDNFMVDNHGNYLLSDFGISKQLRRTMTQAPGPRETMVMDSNDGERFQRSGYTPLPYRPPETTDKDFEKRKPVKASDIWALGASLFELATGEVPFGEFGGMVQRQDPIPPDLPTSFSKELNQVLHSCMAKETWDRPTAEDLEKIARHYQNTGTWNLSLLPRVAVQEEVIPPPPEPKVEKKEKKPFPMWIVAVIGVLVLGGIGTAVFSGGEDEPDNTETNEVTINTEENRPSWETESDEGNNSILDSDDVKETEEPDKTAALEEAAYQLALNTNTEQGFQRYLNAYPHAAHSAEVEDLLEAKIAEKADAADKTAYEKAKKANTQGAYQIYLNQYPDGAYAEDAKRHMKDLAEETKYKGFISKGDSYLKRKDCGQATYYYEQALATGYNNTEANSKIRKVASNCKSSKVVSYPKVARQPGDPVISKIEVSDKETVITLVFKTPSTSGQLFAPGHKDAFRLEKSKGNVLSPLRAIRGMKGNAYGKPFTTPLRSFQLVFDPIPAGMNKVSLIEGTSLVEGETYWNYIKIDLSGLD